MSGTFLGIGDYAVSNEADSVLKTYLGSCVAVILLDPITRTVGMVHIALPDSSLDPSKKELLPGYFADSGIAVLFNKMKEYGFSEKSHKLIVKLVGGASVMSQCDVFNIGLRNVEAAKSILKSMGLHISSEDVGEKYSRSVAIEVDTGKVTVSSPGRGQWDI